MLVLKKAIENSNFTRQVKPCITENKSVDFVIGHPNFFQKNMIWETNKENLGIHFCLLQDFCFSFIPPILFNMMLV